MEVDRKPYQGILNIIRFNWHFYLLAFITLTLIMVSSKFIDDELKWISLVAGTIMIIPILISLFISHYIYDLSTLYELKWLNSTNRSNYSILNVNAGFDETSTIIQNKFPDATLTVCDFYDPLKHTEVSIKRARKAYPSFPGTISIKTGLLPFSDHSYDRILATFAIHEIRDYQEREKFISELKRILKPDGRIYITEHLRDFNNFLAYAIGFFHFYSKKDWMNRFNNVGLNLSEEIDTTPFIKTFVLKPNGNTP